MAVAKSFQSMKQIGEPYPSAGKMYVRVENPKTGTIRQVRWYSEAEYAKLYPEEAVVAEVTKMLRTQKEVLGFDKGYITIFKGDTYAELEWFQRSIARYTKLWGWYIISTEEVPEDLPPAVHPIQLPWTAVGNDNGTLKIDSEVIKAVESYLYDAGTSEYVGEVGERLTLDLTVKSSRTIDGYYGSSIAHTMEDECGNIFVWITAAKNWPAGTKKTIKGTVKEHKIYRNQKQTILTRCTEV